MLQNNHLYQIQLISRDKLEEEKQMPAIATTYLRDLPSNTMGRIVGYDKAFAGYRGKLLSMGLTPGTKFTLIRVGFAGEPVVIEVEGINLKLRKQEADALVVEELGYEDE